MSNDKNNQFHGEILTPEIARKQVIEIGKTNRVAPEVGIFDAPVRCFRVNQEWWGLIAGQVHWLADVAAWQDAEDESYPPILEILKFMQGFDCADGSEPMLRQKPTDDCVLQQSLDNGETWTDIFDFSLCVTIQDKSYQVQIQNQVTYVQPTFEETYNYYTANYSGTPESVHDNLADPTGNSATLRAAYCNALWSLVNSACNAAISFYTEQVDQSQGQVNVGLAITAFMLTAISLAAAVPTAGASLTGLAPAAALWAAGIGLGGVLGNSLVNFWQSHTIEQFQDDAAKEDLVCYLFEAVPADEVTPEALKEALDLAGGPANMVAIAQFLSILLEHDSTYAAFLEKWSNNKEYADAGISLHCPCYDPTWKFKVYDFTATNGGWRSDPTLPGTSVMSWVSGQGWTGGGTNPAVGSIVLDVEPGYRIRGVGWNGRALDNTALNPTQRNWWFRPTANSNVGQGNVNLSNGSTYLNCRENLDATGYEQFAISQNAPAGKTIVIEKAIIIFYPEETPYDAVVTEDDSVCAR